jgi:hypothetical protein
MTPENIFSLEELNELVHGRPGTHDVPCPLCGPDREAAFNRRRRVLRVWRVDPGYATYHCARCGIHGWARDNCASSVDRITINRMQAELAAREREAAATGLQRALYLWRVARPAAGTIVETYLRSRGISVSAPAALRFLAPTSVHAPTMVAAFGIPDEPEPGAIRIAGDQIRGVHLTRLLPDGSNRERGDRAKIMLGRSGGSPIVLAPPNDLLGLAVTEGIEDALSAHEATGLGAWAAGSASRLPALAAAIPSYIECVTIYAHADDAGQRGAAGLVEALDRRGIEVVMETM